MENFDLRKYLVENQLTSEENLEEGWKQAIGGALIALGTLAGIGKIYAPKVGDSITSVDQNREALKAFNDALYGMSMRDSKSLDNLFRTIENSEFKDELKPSQAHYTSQGDSASLASSRLQSQVDALTQVIKANMDHFAISEKGTVLFMKDPESLQALEAGEKIRPVNDRGPELKEEKSKLKMKKSELKEMIKAAFMNEVGPLSISGLSSLGSNEKYKGPGSNRLNDPEFAPISHRADQDGDEPDWPSQTITQIAAQVKNASDVAEKMMEFFRLVAAGENIDYEEQGKFTPIIKLLSALAEPSLGKSSEDSSLEESLDEMLARLSEVDSLFEAEEEDVKVKVKVDNDEEVADEIDLEDEVDTDTEEKSANDSIVIDKKIVSLSSLPGETRKILDTLETLRAQAEEFGDQKFITQVGNTITFFTRDFVVAGDAPNPAGIEEETINYSDNTKEEAELELESLQEVKRMKKLAGIIK